MGLSPAPTLMKRKERVATATQLCVTTAGELTARGHPSLARTQPPRDKHASGVPYGRLDRQLNAPPTRPTPASRAAHSVTAATPQSAGGARAKRRVPYHPAAARSRLPAAFKRDPPPFASTMVFAGGVVNANAHPFRTVAAAAQDGVAVPMRARLGFTNGGICAAIHQRLRARVLGA